MPQNKDYRFKEDHIKRHKELHRALDELMADMIGHTKIRPSECSLMQLVNWSFEQTKNPTEKGD